MSDFCESDLEAYLDESLPSEAMASVERALRADRSLVERLAAIQVRRDEGVHSLGEIWRRHRLSCPTRDQLGSFLLGVLPEPQARYIAFHVETVGCRYCQANWDDLRAQQTQAESAAAQARRRKYFQSSAGKLAKQGGG